MRLHNAHLHSFCCICEQTPFSPEIYEGVDILKATWRGGGARGLMLLMFRNFKHLVFNTYTHLISGCAFVAATTQICRLQCTSTAPRFAHKKRKQGRLCLSACTGVGYLWGHKATCSDTLICNQVALATACWHSMCMITMFLAPRARNSTGSVAVGGEP